MKSRRVFLGMIALGLAAGSGGPSPSAEIVLDFDDLAVGTAFTEASQPYDHLGVTIRGTRGSIPTVFDPSTATDTEPRALINEACSEFGSYDEDVEIFLEGFTATQVSACFGLAETPAEQTGVEMEVRYLIDGHPGPFIAGNGLYLGAAPVAPTSARRIVLGDADGGIGYIRISYGNTSGREVIDTLVIQVHEGDPPPPPADTADPAVTITEPEVGEDVSTGNVGVFGYVDEETALSRIELRIEGTTLAVPLDGLPPRYFFAVLVHLEPPSGNRTVEVQAWDLAGNTDTATRSFDYEHVEDPPPPQPPPPYLDIVGRGMEVTQSIQGWGMIGSTPQDVHNRTSLVAGKKTLVRVYAEALDTTEDIPDIGCMLRAYRLGVEVPGSPIYAADRVTLVPGESYLEQRPDATKSFNFWLPPEWTVPGLITLWATVNHFNGTRERDGAFDEGNDVVREDLSFHDTDDFCVIFYPLVLSENGDLRPTHNDILINYPLIEQTYPVAGDRFSMSISQTVTTDHPLDETNDLIGILGQFRRYLGFYRGMAEALPCTHTSFIAMVSPNHTDYGGITDCHWPVSISYAGDDHKFKERTAHESGHAHGLGHVLGCDDPDAPYEDYPAYDDPVLVHTWYPDASIGDWGAEFKDDGTFELRDPATWRDLMSYCLGDRWISPYTHHWLFGHFTSGGGGGHLGSPWDLPSPGGGALVPYLIVNGTLGPDGATLDPTWSVDLPEGSNDKPGLGTWRIALLGTGGNVLFERFFKPVPLANFKEYALVDEVMPAQKGVVAIRMAPVEGISKPAVIQAGASAPTVTVTTPRGGETWEAAGTETVQWKASDADGDPLVYAVHYSNDMGKSWEVLASNLRQPSFTVELEGIPGGSKSCLIRVAASDGIHQGEGVSPLPFTKKSLPPIAKILSPAPVHGFPYGRPVIFEAAATDREDGWIPASRIRWRSDRDGPLGKGKRIASSTLSPGLHVITLDAVDSDGMQSSDRTGVFIEDPRETDLRLPKTGQKLCWDKSGASADCAGTGHDGEIRAGVAWPVPRFTKNADTSFTDNLTGLVWAPDGSVPKFMNCPGGPRTWDEALDYVECLNAARYLGHGDWRLPHIGEILSTVHLGIDDPAGWLNQGFEGVAASRYWSSTSRAANKGHAWFASLGTGEAGFAGRSAEYLVWPVRSAPGMLGDPRYPAKTWKTGQTVSYGERDDGDLRKGAYWPGPRFTTNGNGTVMDNLTGLLWLQNPGCLGTAGWQGALDKVEALNERPETVGCKGYGAAFRDWRLPNYRELESIIDYSRSGPALPEGHPFTVLPAGEYWSSTSFQADPDNAWYLGLADGVLDTAHKVEEMNSIWPVRGGDDGPPDLTGMRISIREDRDPVAVGGTVTYTVTATNGGPDEATGIRIATDLPAGIKVLAVTSPGSACAQAPGSVACDLEKLGRGESAAVAIQVRAPGAPGTIAISSRVSCSTDDPNTADDSARESTRVVETTGALFRRGFVDDSKTIDITDAVLVLGYLFLGSPADLPCMKAADAGDDGKVDITDAIGILGFLFLGAGQPADPYAACGQDPTEDLLTCEKSAQCP